MNWNNDESNTLSQTFLTDKSLEEGGVGVMLTFDMLKQQLVATGQMKPDNFFYQVYIKENGIVLLYNSGPDNYKFTQEQ